RRNQASGGETAHVADGQPDGRQGWRKSRGHWTVVEADHGQLIRDRYPQVECGFVDAGRHLVVAGKDGGGTLTSFQQGFGAGDTRFEGKRTLDHQVGWHGDAALFQRAEKAPETLMG